MNSLIIGGTSGLGLEIAKQMQEVGDDVTVTGRRELNEDGITVEHFDLSEPELPRRINELVMKLPEIDVIVYAAGYFQDGRVTDLSDEQIEEMIDVGGRGLIYLMRSILDKQDHLPELVTITSTSQWTPREREPIYNFTKAGAAHFSHAMARDGRVDKVLVAGPAGMRTRFQDGRELSDGELETYLDPTWVAEQVMGLRGEDYSYRFAKILRDPPTVEIVETES